MSDYECHICRTKMWWKNRIDPVCPKCDPEKAGIKSFNDKTACKELVDKTGRMRLVACGVVAMSNTPDSAAKAREMLPEYRSASCDGVARAVDREMGLREQLATVTAQRDLLGKILSCQVKLNESEACLVYQDCYEALASLKGE